jgi:hypothetical protein
MHSCGRLLTCDNIGAVDTNSTALRAIFYYLVKSPRTYATLVKELQDADAKGLLSDVLSFQEGQKLSYLYDPQSVACRWD